MPDKLYEVLSPNKNFTGRRFDVMFVNGKGQATRRQATVLVKNWGYSCPELDAELKAAKNPVSVAADKIEPEAVAYPFVAPQGKHGKK